MDTIITPKADEQGFDEEYRGWQSQFASADNKEQYIHQYASLKLTPFYLGGNLNGYRHGTAIKMMVEAADAMRRNRDEITVLDAGCGRGELSVYLACLGFRVVGVDISAEGCALAGRLAERLGVVENCKFLAESLEHITLEDNSVDFIVGIGTLHHFVKYGGVPAEFLRIMKGDARGFFVDPFQENFLYRLFHDKKKMERLGDCLLTKRLITSYFRDFHIELLPTDWFVMFDKILDRIFKLKVLIFRRRLSNVFFSLDRWIPSNSRVALLLSGSVITYIRKPGRGG